MSARQPRSVQVTANDRMACLSDRRLTDALVLAAAVLMVPVAPTPVRAQAAFEGVRLSEYVARNDTGLRDESGAREDWIELHNRSEMAVDLSGWRLTDDPADLARWIFPARTLPPGGYLVVFASGKNRMPVDGPLHTNFRINGAEGDWLALVRPDGVVVDSFSALPQFSNLAYGWGVGSQGEPALGYLTPTPSAANGSVFAHGLNQVHFSVGRGFYSEAPVVSLTADVPGSIIRYTLNGTRPTATTGLVYDGPITVVPETVATTRGSRRLRAAAFHPTAAVQAVATHTYFFLNGLTAPAVDGLLGQTNSNQSSQTTAIKNHPIYGPLLGEALTALPAVSINLAATAPGANEAPASVEFFDPSGRESGFQIDCGIQAVGGHSINSPKNNFRLYFRSQYGASTLDYDLFRDHPYTGGRPPARRFDRLALRSGSHDSFFWMAQPSNPPMSGVKGGALYLRTPVMDDLHLSLGHAAPHNRYAQLWLNGRYHGLYHWREYPNNDFMASYRGGQSEDYEFTNGANPSENGSATWRTAWTALRAAVAKNHEEAARWINLPQLADFMVLNFWAGNAWDWNPNQNWMAAGPKRPDRGGWTFFSYDNDVIWNDLNANLTIPTAPYYVNNPRPGIMPPDGLMVTSATSDTTLMDHEEFRVLFRDRAYKAFFHGGALEPDRARARLDHRVQELMMPLVAETSRWQPTEATRLPWDRDGEWMAEVRRIRDVFMPARPAAVLNQIRARGWYPVEAPEFSPHGGPVAAGTAPVITSATDGTEVYFTVDGSDPRRPGGILHPSARLLTDPPPPSLAVTRPLRVRMRARRLADGQWSPLNEAAFHTGSLQPAGPGNIVISQIHCAPGPVGDEFLEVMNVSTERVDLSGCFFTRGLNFTFPADTVLFPGERRAVFQSEFRNGTSLANGGERLTLVGPDGSVIRDHAYGTTLPWPTQTLGTGRSLVLVAPEVATDAWAAQGLNWRASTTTPIMPVTAASDPHRSQEPVDGTPYPLWKLNHGLADDDDDRDGDGLNALLEYATGSHPDQPDSTGLPELHATPAGLELWVWANAERTGITLHLETSRDLITWSAASPFATTARASHGPREKFTFLLPALPTSLHWRLRVSSVGP